MSEVSRLGREQIETAYALKQLSVAGVRCFSYLEDRELLMESATDKFLLGAVTFAADLEREKARQRVHDAMLRKARAGHATGGKTFGYDNCLITDDAGRRSHVERHINRGEAEIVRRIFSVCACGAGYTRIAKLLNAEHAPSPRPKCGRPATWAPSSVKEILDRRLYLGEVVWNRTEKRDSWGQKNQHDRPESDWIRTAAPQLRIVSDDEWQAAHGRISATRASITTLSRGQQHQAPRRSRDIESNYLLSGFARCAVCGGGLGVMGGSRTRARPHSYGCLSYHKRGTAVCGNGLKMPIDRVDDAVLRTLGGDVLRPAVILAVVDGVLAALEPRNLAQEIAQMRSEREAVEREMGNLVKAIAAGGPLETLVVELKARETRRGELVTAITGREAVDVGRFNRKAIEQAVRDQLNNWRTVLTRHVADARQLLREVLAGPLRFTPVERTYRFEGEASIGRLVAGTAGLPTCVVAVRGFEPRSRG